MTRLVPFKVKVLGCDECGAMYGDTENGRRYHAHIPPPTDPDGRYDNELVIEQEDRKPKPPRFAIWEPPFGHRDYNLPQWQQYRWERRQRQSMKYRT